MAVKNFQLGFSSTGKLIYMKIDAQSQGRMQEPRYIKEPIYLLWEEYLAEWKKTAPSGVSNLFQEANYAWAFNNGEVAMFNGAITGIVISVTLAFVILLIATRNYIISFFAILAVGCICSNVVGLMVLLGWQMGVSESIAMVIIIGFSVDYVVHLAAHYVHSAKKTRLERASESIRDMGISIFSGAITTFGSSIFLYTCQVKFFVKFATIMASTVVLSLIYAFLFFLALAHALGPEYNQGSITHCLRNCK